MSYGLPTTKKGSKDVTSTQKDTLSGNNFYGQGYSEYQTIIPVLTFSTPRLCYVEILVWPSEY